VKPSDEFPRDDETEEAPKSTPRLKRKQGFASRSETERREVASRGGKAAQASGNAHRWTSDEARHAGRIGGEVSARKRGAKATP
jgi:uncharacterized protein